MRKPMPVAMTATLLTMLAGCAVGPDFVAPDKPKTDRYTADTLSGETVSTPIAGGEAQKLLPGAEIPARWWELFGSPLISQRIQLAFANSPTLAGAQASLRQAQENAAAAAGGFFPSISGSGTATRQKSTSAAFGALGGGQQSSFIYNLYGASVDVGYTLDLFGGVRRTVEAQRAQAEFQHFQLEATYLTLAANVVTASVQEASLQTQLVATEDIVRAFEEQVRITDKQYELGAIAQADVLASRTQLEATRATLPGLRQQLMRARNQLAIYLGQLPSEQDSASLDLTALKLPQQVPLSLPSELARQRPDVRAAEAQLHVASANVGVATAAMFPSLTISASYGGQSGRATDLFKAASEIWSVSGGLTAPIFRGGELRARRRAAIAAYDQASANYRQTVLEAFANVADSLYAIDNDAAALRARHAALQSAEKNLDLVRKSYRAGAVGYLNVLDAQRQHQEARINFISAQAARFADTAALFQALGGGWWNREETAPVVVTPVVQ